MLCCFFFYGHKNFTADKERNLLLLQTKDAVLTVVTKDFKRDFICRCNTVDLSTVDAVLIPASVSEVCVSASDEISPPPHDARLHFK